MRVALVIYGSIETISGGYLYDRMLVSKLRQRGDTVEIISLPRRPYAVSVLDNFRIQSRAAVDVVLQDELNHPSLFISNRRPHDAPIVTIVHHLRSSEHRAAWQNSIYRNIERCYLESVDACVFNSETTRASVERLVGNAKACVVATPGGDRLGRATETSIQSRAGAPGPLRLLFVGALTRAKGLAILLHALEGIPSSRMELRVVGSGSADPRFAEQLRQRVDALQLPVTFCGELERKALVTELRTAQVLVLPSYYEGFGISVLEGAAHGLAAIGARAGALPELIEDGATGLLFTPGDSSELAERLGRLWADRALLSRLGLRALRKFGDYPTWDETTDKIREFLVSVAARHHLGYAQSRGK